MTSPRTPDVAAPLLLADCRLLQPQWIAYRLFDIGYAIDLNKAFGVLAENVPARSRPVRVTGQALQIPTPPMTVPLGRHRLVLGDTPHVVELEAQLFDFGTISVRVRLRGGDMLYWGDAVRLGAAFNRSADVATMAEIAVVQLMTQLTGCIDRPALSPLREEYTVIRVVGIEERDTPLSRDALQRIDAAPLLLFETQALSPRVSRDLLPHRFAYYENEVAIISWESAFVVEPGEHDSDVQYLLEIATAQLLELRYYDALLDAELPRMYEAIATARRTHRWFPGRRFRGLLARLQELLADFTALVEHVENAVKFTDDAYAARVYATGLDIFRCRVWRAGIDRKLGIIRDTYTMLNDEADTARSETLEIAIVALIVLEIVIATFGRGH